MKLIEGVVGLKYSKDNQMAAHIIRANKPHWLIIVSALLFVFGLGLFASSCIKAIEVSPYFKMLAVVMVSLAWVFRGGGVKV